MAVSFRFYSLFTNADRGKVGSFAQNEIDPQRKTSAYHRKRIDHIQ